MAGKGNWFAIGPRGKVKTFEKRSDLRSFIKGQRDAYKQSGKRPVLTDSRGYPVSAEKRRRITQNGYTSGEYLVRVVEGVTAEYDADGRRRASPRSLSEIRGHGRERQRSLDNITRQTPRFIDEQITPIGQFRALIKADSISYPGHPARISPAKADRVIALSLKFERQQRQSPRRGPEFKAWHKAQKSVFYQISNELKGLDYSLSPFWYN